VSGPSWIALGLIMAVVSGLGAVYVRHSTRALHAELEVLRERRDTLTMDWNRFELELSTLAAPALVDREARRRLHMRPPAPDSVRYLRP